VSLGEKFVGGESQFERSVPSAAEAAVDFAAVAARLEAVPFQSKIKGWANSN